MVSDDKHEDHHHEEQSVFHYSITAPAVTVKVERNSRGYNWEAAVSGARTVDEALDMLRAAEAQLRTQYGETAQ